MGFTSSLADPDVWFRAATIPNGYEYYEYILAYVDDISISHDPEKILLSLADFYCPAKFLSDNQAVILDSTVPLSTLRCKHNAICYH